ncbi:MAG: hypothetical protein A3D31_02185 [Candidatus Fluviicola riflensis]|nr:MAG: hypothetical protein A3D31_02185 [Candidatus Fluviicola riflensis]OGS85826.1 MAG: hypothetical protein A3E30_09670 [Fluviicola sp. RIFCSPHIGHO2_12_FULL_43_24]OGS86235.1 MAG: hypothetical protein A2724_01640 [Fluviicola sp. RIFCSPHIGHO2_01_FULL_43_53]
MHNIANSSAFLNRVNSHYCVCSFRPNLSVLTGFHPHPILNPYFKTAHVTKPDRYVILLFQIKYLL